MERLLVLWLEEQNQRRIPVSLMVIQEKAKRLFEALKEEKGEGSESEEFMASRGKELFFLFINFFFLTPPHVPTYAENRVTTHVRNGLTS